MDSLSSGLIVFDFVIVLLCNPHMEYIIGLNGDLYTMSPKTEGVSDNGVKLPILEMVLDRLLDKYYYLKFYLKFEGKIPPSVQERLLAKVNAHNLNVDRGIDR